MLGKFFNPKSVPNFNSNQVETNHKILTQFHRLVGSSGIKANFGYILDIINNSFINHPGNREFSYEIYHENLSLLSASNTYQYQSSFDNIIIKLSPNINNFTNFRAENKEITPLIFSTHYDSFDIGPSTYDGSIIVAVLLEIARMIYTYPEEIHQPVYFAILGSGKWGSHGSVSLCQELQKQGIKRAFIFTLDSIGVGRPLSMVGHSYYSYNLLKAWTQTPYSISSTFINDLYNFLQSQSYYDSKIYKENGYSWSQSIFMGNPAIYHTSFDDFHDSHDIIYLGQQIFDFWKNFDHLSKNHPIFDEKDNDAVAFGITPFSICIKKSRIKNLSISTILISLTIVIHHFYRIHNNISDSNNFNIEIDSFKQVAKAFFTYIQSFAICTIFSVMVNKINPLSFMDHQLFSFFALIIMIALVSMILNLTSNFRSSSLGFMLFHLINHLLFLFLTRNSDFSIYYFLSVIVQTLQFTLYSLMRSKLTAFTIHQSLFNYKKLYTFINSLFLLLQLFPVSFTFSVIRPTLFGLTTNASKPLGTFVLIISSYFALELITPIFTNVFSISPSQDPFEKSDFYQTMKKDGEDEDEKPKQRDRLEKKAERIEAEDERIKCYYNGIKQTKLENSWFSISIVMLVFLTCSYFMYLILKDHPFSPNYPLKGTITHVYDGKSESTVSFMPLFQSPLHRNIKNAMTNAVIGQHNLSFISNYKGLLKNGDALVQKFKGQKIPYFLKQWPNFSIISENLQNNNKPYLVRRRVKFHENDIPSEIHQGLFIFKCKPSQTCVKKLSILNRSEKIVHHNNQVVIRIIPLDKNFDLDVEVQGPPLTAEILFISSKRSKELDYFRHNLNDYIQCYASEQIIINTVIKNTTII